MKNLKKKGFTIVELVIVIAVIAVLAAVLIPTFVNLTRKANISADTVLAKNLNTALAVYDAENDIEDFDDVLEAIKEHGYLIANLNAKADGCYFVWESETNQILLVDSTERYKVLYSAKDINETPDNSWYFAISNKEKAEEVALALQNVNVKKTAANINDFQELLSTGGTQTIYIDESVVVSSNNTIKINDDDANITLKLGKSSLASDGPINKIPVEVIKGKLTIEGGFIGGSGKFTNENGTFSTAVGFEGTAKNLTLIGVTVIGKGNAVCGANNTDGPIHVEIKDSKLSSDNVGFQMSDGTATLSNTEINCPNPIFATYGTKITIKSGTYTSTTDCLFEMHDNTDGLTEVIVEDGDFKFETLCIFNGDAKITITGGKFNGINYLEYFANITEIGGATVSITGSTVTISK